MREETRGRCLYYGGRKEERGGIELMKDAEGMLEERKRVGDR